VQGVSAWRVQAIRDCSILRKLTLNSEARNEFGAEYQDRVRKIRKAADESLRELSQLRSSGPMARETFDTEVGRIAREKLHPHGCDLVVHRLDDGITRFVIEVQRTGRRYDLIKSFFHRDEGFIREADV
jgi:hypothetical protein